MPASGSNDPGEGWAAICCVPLGLLYFVPNLLLFIYTLFSSFLLLSLSHLIFDVPMLNCGDSSRT